VLRFQASVFNGCCAIFAPRYQLYIYILLLEKFFVAQDERAFEASICDVRSQNQPSFC